MFRGPLLLGILHLAFADCAIYDNNLVEVPKIKCAHDRIVFSIHTKQPFTGHLFVKGMSHQAECDKTFTHNTDRNASIAVHLPKCGMRRADHPSTSYSIAFVVSFHPVFVTKLDRAYNAHCMYKTQEQTVTALLDISTLPTNPMAAQAAPLPRCEYTIRAETLMGPVVEHVQLGDTIVHRWECFNPSVAMLVKNCFVKDNGHRREQIVDHQGCPLISSMFEEGMKYERNLSVASAKVLAYKFPDRSELSFQCDISLCRKETDDCGKTTPPKCADKLEEELIHFNENEDYVHPMSKEPVTYVVGTFDSGPEASKPLIRPYRKLFKRSSKTSSDQFRPVVSVSSGKVYVIDGEKDQGDSELTNWSSYCWQQTNGSAFVGAALFLTILNGALVYGLWKLKRPSKHTG